VKRFEKTSRMLREPLHESVCAVSVRMRAPSAYAVMLALCYERYGEMVSPPTACVPEHSKTLELHG
jgi:hypothetical protein